MNRREFVKIIGVGAVGLMIDGKIFAEAKGESEMKIQAVKFYEKGFMTQPFACGLEDGEEKFDKNVKYRSSLQNFMEIFLTNTNIS